MSTSQFLVRWNGEDIGSFAPDNFDIKHLKLTVLAGKSNQLKLVATGASDCLGITVANFRLFKTIRNDGYPGFVDNV